METNKQATTGLSEARRTLLRQYLSGGAAGNDAKPAAIPKRKESGPAPLSYSQQQMWLHSQLAGAYLINNEPIAIHRHGELNVSALERSFLEIVCRHEAWRTTFHWNGHQGVQIIQPAPAHIEIPFTDLRAHPDAEREALRLATGDVRQPFDLARGPMYRLRLVRLAESEHRLFLTLHHIIFDGVSLHRVFLPELLTSYEAFAKNTSPALEKLPIQYVDYATWQRNSTKEISPEQLSYWQTVCADLPVLELRTDHPRPPAQTYAGATELFQISPATSAALKILSQEQGATLYMTMTAAFMALLHGYTGQEDIVVGGISSCHNHEKTMGLLGCFLNTVAIRCAFSKDLPFTELLARTRNATLGALSHEVPFELLVQKLTRKRDPSRSPLVQALIVVEPPMMPLKEGWAFTHLDVDAGTAKFDLQLDLDDRKEGFRGRFIYNTDLFERETIEVMKLHWLELLDRIAAAPTKTVRDLTPAVWRDAVELEKPPIQWSGARADYPRDSTIHKVFEQQAERTPSALALVFQDERLSYDALNRRANRLARQLRKLGVDRDVPVGVWMERSAELVIALLAILKSGGAYVPLDPSYPAERLALMIDDTKMPVILTQERMGNGEISQAQKAQVLRVNAGSFAEEDDGNLESDVRAQDLAYVMYTSGSTGTPKGVAVPHRAVLRLVQSTDYASFSPEERFLQLAPISFDASTFEIWGPLLNGGRLVVLPAALPTLGKIGNAIHEHGITTLWLTAGLFNAMVDERLRDLRPLRQLLAGGDVLSVPHVSKALHELKNTRLINGYGPTESTTFACCHMIPPDARLDGAIPIGKPINNTTAYILDANLQLVSIGVRGELFIGGDGLARGYWRRDELTAEKFIADPFSTEPGARLYRTGDLARWRRDGVIEFLGRADNQIKLRGYRIEPGEIETALKRQPGVLDSAVIVREDTPGNKRLVAYVVRTQGASLELDQPALIAALKKSLPEYLVPSAIVALPAMPRTPNGKLDRAALPAPHSPKPSVVFVERRTPLEEKIAMIWTDVLDVNRVGLTDNFFALGGHSLLGLRLMNELGEALGEQLALAIIFEAPTVARMADLLEKNFPAAVARWTGRPGGADAGAATNQTLTASRSPGSVVRINRESRRVRRPVK